MPSTRTTAPPTSPKTALGGSPRFTLRPSASVHRQRRGPTSRGKESLQTFCKRTPPDRSTQERTGRTTLSANRLLSRTDQHQATRDNTGWTGAFRLLIRGSGVRVPPGTPGVSAGRSEAFHAFLQTSRLPRGRWGWDQRQRPIARRLCCARRPTTPPRRDVTTAVLGIRRLRRMSAAGLSTALPPVPPN